MEGRPTWQPYLDMKCLTIRYENGHDFIEVNWNPTCHYYLQF